MARFALFETDAAARRSHSSSISSTSSTPASSSSPNLNVSRQKAQPPSERRISSNPSITDSTSSESATFKQTICEPSMRTSHSDTNLMERFRRGNFMTSLVGTRKSFTLQKRKSKKERKQDSSAESSGHRSSKEIVFPADQATELKRFVSIEDIQPVQQVESSLSSSSASSPDSSPMPHVPSSSSDYLLHSRSLECFQPQQSQLHRPKQAEHSPDQKAPSPHSSFKSKPPFSKPHSATYDQSMKKSWLYPMAFINCCLTRTDSLPDIHSSPNTSQSRCSEESVRIEQLDQHLAEMVSMEDMPADHQLDADHDELIHSLNDLFLSVNRASTPNQMISLNAQSERERANYFHDLPDGAELVLQPLANGPHSGENEGIQELRRFFHNQQPPILPILSSFSLSQNTDPDRLFPPSNYPLNLSRMFGPRQQQESGSIRPTNVQSAHSINSINSILPYPPPTQLRSQRHFNAHNNPIHTQIDYINCLVPDLKAISNCSFYWGKMDRYEAERLLEGKPEGTFLLRDSAQEDHLFSVSFRRFDRSLHARIEQWKHRFSFDSHDPGVYSSNTVTGLIEHYKDPSHCMFFEPMLTKPLNRSTPFSLQHLARVTVADTMSYDSINDLPLPLMLKSFLKEYHYRQKVRTKHFDDFTYLSNYYQH